MHEDIYVRRKTFARKKFCTKGHFCTRVIKNYKKLCLKITYRISYRDNINKTKILNDNKKIKYYLNISKNNSKKTVQKLPLVH